MLISILFHHWYAVVPALGSLGGGITWLVRRYRRSVSKDLQPFRSYVLGNVRLSVGRRFSPLLARQFGLRAYAARSIGTFPRLLPVPSIHRVTLDIDRAYIRLSLVASPTEKLQDIGLLNLRSGNVLILGDPGSGKSSLTRKLFREASKQAYLRPFHSRLPLHIELRTVPWANMPAQEHESGDWFLEVLLESITKVKGLHDPAFLADAFMNGPGIVAFLDGLDEVPVRTLAGAISAIRLATYALRQSSKNTVIVMTARTQIRGSLTRKALESFSHVFTVEPFTPADIFAFLRRWPFRGEPLREAQRIFERLRINPTLMEMCTNPLILAMYVAHDQRYADDRALVRLPDTRTEFYREVIGELLLFRREEHSDGVIAGTQLRKLRERLLGKVALTHLMDTDEPANSISFQYAVNTLQQLWYIATEEDAIKELSQLAIETGVFAEERHQESIRFMHLSLCEYLAGKELAEGDDHRIAEALNQIVDFEPNAPLPNLSYRRMWETLIFAVALSPRARQLWALGRLDDARSLDQLLLRALRELQAYDWEGFPSAIHRVTEDLSATPSEDWDANWFSQIRVVLSVLNDAQRLSGVQRSAFSVPGIAEWLQMLVLGDKSRLEKIFGLYLTESPAEALRVAELHAMRGRLLADRQRILGAMEHPDLIGFGISSIAEDGNFHDHWREYVRLRRVSLRDYLPGAVRNDDVEILLRNSPRAESALWVEYLSEAALRSELVAQILNDEPIPRSIEQPLRSVAREHAWHSLGPLSGSLYGGLLALASSTAHPLREWQQPRKVRRVDLISLLDAGMRLGGRDASTRESLEALLKLTPGNQEEVLPTSGVAVFRLPKVGRVAFARSRRLLERTAILNMSPFGYGRSVSSKELVVRFNRPGVSVVSYEGLPHLRQMITLVDFVEMTWGRALRYAPFF